MTKIQTLLDDYRQEWVDYDANAKNKPDAQKPTPPDFAALATEYNMSAGRTGLISQIELAETRPGQIVQPPAADAGLQSMFGATTLYKPDVSDYRRPASRCKRTYFVFWKIDDQPDHIPNWEDPGIQAEVLRVWKLNEARKWPKRAEELKAEAAAKPGKSLKELASGKKKDFTVLTPAAVQFLDSNVWIGELQLGEVPGLEKIASRPGLPFMQKVFSLAPNQVDVATNLPKTEIYVVRAVEFTPFEELWSDFTADADDWSIYTLFAPRQDRENCRPAFDNWRGAGRSVAGLAGRRFMHDAGLKWEKPADQRSAPGESPGPSPGRRIGSV